jgi:hypothetical protein
VNLKSETDRQLKSVRATVRLCGARPFATAGLSPCLGGVASVAMPMMRVPFAQKTISFAQGTGCAQAEPAT